MTNIVISRDLTPNNYCLRVEKFQDGILQHTDDFPIADWNFRQIRSFIKRVYGWKDVPLHEMLFGSEDNFDYQLLLIIRHLKEWGWSDKPNNYNQAYNISKRNDFGAVMK